MTKWRVSPRVSLAARAGSPSLRSDGPSSRASGMNSTRCDTSMDVAPYMKLRVLGPAVAFGAYGKD